MDWIWNSRLLHDFLCGFLLVTNPLGSANDFSQPLIYLIVTTSLVSAFLKNSVCRYWLVSYYTQYILEI